VLTGFTVTLAAATALLAGLVDAIAGGGGLLTLPALLALGLPPHAALGTNKGQAVFGAVASFWTFWRKGGIDRDRAPVGFGFGLVGSALGAALVLLVRPEPLKPVVMALLVCAAGVVLARGYVRAEARVLLHPLRAAALIALGLGAYDGFFGPGVGSLLIVAFMLVFGDGVTRASGNAKVVNLASNLAAVLIFAWRGTILWEIALPMALANAVGASIGARLALWRGDRLVRVAVLLVVCALVAKLGLDMAR
jgi:uncharacterized membrane protein YfcA